ncbi:MAG: ROK family transcriptional regulator [Fervidobacterium sp.]|uniref:ROK family transcriptional regulator n=1 Tax=Fervidobacterium sp. TaxID=1871331 RepID=UPI00404B9DEA
MNKKLNPVSMKRKNKKMVMRYLMEKGHATRSEIAHKTGLALSAIWRLMGELESENLIEVKNTSSGRGRKSLVYAPTTSFITSVIYNVEVKETIVAVGFLDGSWKIVENFLTPDSFGEFKRIALDLFYIIQKNYKINSNITKIVFSLPGMVDYKRKFLICAPNLDWKDLNLQTEFEEMGLEVLAENDANLSLLAELFFSNDVKESKVAFFLYFGEGIGGSIAVNGDIVRGKNSIAGEIGHVELSVSNTELEKLLSLSSIFDRMESPVLHKNATAKDKFELMKKLWYEGHSDVKYLVDDFIYHLSLTVRNMGYLLNPDIIVLGGLINDIYETFSSEIDNRLNQIIGADKVFDVHIRDTVFKEVPPSLVGANVLALENFLRSFDW